MITTACGTGVGNKAIYNSENGCPAVREILTSLNLKKHFQQLLRTDY
jgi:hypothetical protein